MRVFGWFGVVELSTQNSNNLVQLFSLYTIKFRSATGYITCCCTEWSYSGHDELVVNGMQW